MSYIPPPPPGFGGEDGEDVFNRSSSASIAPPPPPPPAVAYPLQQQPPPPPAVAYPVQQPPPPPAAAPLYLSCPSCQQSLVADQLPAHVASHLQQLQSSLNAQQQLSEQLEAAHRNTQERLEQSENEASLLSRKQAEGEAALRVKQQAFEQEKFNLQEALREAEQRAAQQEAKASAAAAKLLAAQQEANNPASPSGSGSRSAAAASAHRSPPVIEEDEVHKVSISKQGIPDLNFDSPYASATRGSGAPTVGTLSQPVLTSAELSQLSLTFFPELEPLLGAVVPQHHIYTAARVYLYDSFHCRSIKHSTTLLALTAYQFIHVSKWKLFVRWVGWFHLLLGFIEPPSTILIDGVRYGPSHAASGALEMICLAVYTFHAVKQYQAYGPGKQGFWRSPWRTAKVFVLSICFLDVIVSMARNSDDPAIHLSQILRVFFVLEQSGRMRQLCSCIIKSLPEIISIMFLCLVHIIAFGVFGYLFIGPLEVHSEIATNDLYFSSLTRSFQSTFILLTSENFPEVMLPSYRGNWYVCIYFVCYVLIGLYGLLQLTTAVVFYSFQLHTKDKLQKALHYRERALQASFTLLSEYTCGEGYLKLDTWQKLVAGLRPDWNDTQAEILFRAAVGKSDDELDVPVPANTSGSAPPTGLMDYLQFEQIVRFTQKSFQFVATSASHATDAVSAAERKAGAAMPHSESELGISMATLNSNNMASDSFAGAGNSSSSSATPVRSTQAAAAEYGYHNSGGLDSFWYYMFYYFTYRVQVSDWILKLMGRNEEFIQTRIEAAQEGDAEPDSSAGATPLTPPISLREKFTSFSLCEAVSDSLTILHGFFLVLRMILENQGTVGSGENDALGGLIVFLEVIFALEVFIKLYLCRTTFFKSKLQTLDALCLIVVWVAQGLVFLKHHGSAQDAISAMRLCRLFRLYHRLSSFTMLLKVLSQVGPPLAALFGVLFLLLYTYSMIGMMFFCNNLLPGNLKDDLDYHQGDFYVLNFNDLGHSLVALFYQLVVNDWWILMQAVVFTSNEFARIFFISFYCVQVLIVFSVCTAFVVEAYIDMHEQRVQARGKKSGVITQMEALPMPQPVSLAPGMAKEANAGTGIVESSLSMRGSNAVSEARQRNVSRGEKKPAPLTQSKSFRQFHASLRRTASMRASVDQSGTSGAPPTTTATSSASSSSSSSSTAALNRSGSILKLGSTRNLGRAPAPSVAAMPAHFPSAAQTTTSASVFGSGSNIPMESKFSAASEEQLLSRIRERASSMGMKVKLKPSGGMLNTLKNIFAGELEDENKDDEDEDAVVEETEDTED